MENFINDVKTIFKNNSNLLTGFAVAIILFTGVTLFERPDMWWTVLLLVLSFCVVIFLFMNARVFIKSIVSFIVLSFCVSFSYVLGITFQGNYTHGFFWMMSILSVFFFNLAFSYYYPGGVSRWAVNTVSTIIGFITTSVLISVLSPMVSITIGAVTQLLVFILYYISSRKTRFNKRNVPSSGYSIEEITDISEKLVNSNIKYMMNSNKGFKSVILWDDTYAIQILPVNMRSGFIEEKKKGLTYLEKSINPWLINVGFKLMNVSKVGKTPILNVLLDRKNTNGLGSKTIGVSLPDTKRVIPLGITPAKNIITSPEEIFSQIVKDFENFLEPLSAKQLIKLNKIYEEI